MTSPKHITLVVSMVSWAKLHGSFHPDLITRGDLHAYAAI
jgi:hypothetical protein